jgi:hypothetical protein
VSKLKKFMDVFVWLSNASFLVLFMIGLKYPTLGDLVSIILNNPKETNDFPLSDSMVVI